VVDVLIGAPKLPELGVVGEVLYHILMNQFLKVHAKSRANSANYNVSAYPSFNGKVPIGVIQDLVANVVDDGLANLISSGIDKAYPQLLPDCGRWNHRKQQPGDGNVKLPHAVKYQINPHPSAVPIWKCGKSIKTMARF
jgi:hypothetical protein